MDKLPIPLEFDVAVHMLGPALRSHNERYERHAVAAEARSAWLYVLSNFPPVDFPT